MSGPDNELSILRQLKILVVVLVLSNIALGFLGFYFLRALDRKYSRLIDQTVPTLHQLHTLTAASVDAMRRTNPILLGDSPQSRTEMLQRARAAIERDRDLRNRALKRERLSTGSDEWLDLETAGETFSGAATEIVNLFESGDRAEASRQREQSLRPAFDRYVAATTRTADMLKAQSLRTSGTLTAKTGNVSNMMLGLASWPVIILCAFLLITAVFVMVILLKVFVFKQEAA
jgi:hypothetical protein